MLSDIAALQTNTRFTYALVKKLRDFQCLDLIHLQAFVFVSLTCQLASRRSPFIQFSSKSLFSLVDVSSIADVACTNSIGHWLLHSLCKPLPRRQQVQFGDRLSWRKCHSTGWEEGGEEKGGEGKGRHRAATCKKMQGRAAAVWHVPSGPANASLQPGSSRGNEEGWRYSAIALIKGEVQWGS